MALYTIPVYYRYTLQKCVTIIRRGPMAMQCHRTFTLVEWMVKQFKILVIEAGRNVRRSENESHLKSERSYMNSPLHCYLSCFEVKIVFNYIR